ncbi:response regulator [Myroides sp. LJL119]
MINIAITDDHVLLSQGLQMLFQQQKDMQVVGIYPNAKQMQQGLKQQPIDLLILDINLPDANSIELIEPLKLRYPELLIVIISVHDEYAVINSVLKLGANGYIQKNATSEQLITGIKTVLQGKVYLCDLTQEVVKRKTSEPLDAVPKLTRREKEVLLEASLGLTTQQIADKLFISPHTVESHRKNLIEKFKTKNLSSAITLATQYGLLK